MKVMKRRNKNKEEISVIYSYMRNKEGDNKVVNNTIKERKTEREKDRERVGKNRDKTPEIDQIKEVRVVVLATR
jgi:hypothetical protein